ncbi:MAG: hypothetical protein ACP5IE_00350 [Infirmifilum sp.]|jgi:hypothetical protein
MPRPRKLKRAVIVTVVIEDDIREKAFSRAKALNMSFSEYVRKLIIKDLGESDSQSNISSA